MIKRLTTYTVDKTNPRWRYDLVRNPIKQGFSHCVSLASSKGGRSLLRYVNVLDLNISIGWTPSAEILAIKKQLSPEAQAKFSNVLDIYRKNLHVKKKGKLADPKKGVSFPLWSLKESEKLNDAFFVRLVRHMANKEFDPYIASALSLYNNPAREEAMRFIGYNFYAKKSDAALAKDWSMPVKLIEAIRLLFFDFSSFPKDRLANFTCLRQLVVNGLITDLDFSYYKRIYELGELGLKAQIDFINLTDEEKSKVKDYLATSHTTTVLNLNFSVQCKKDAAQYLGALHSLTDLTIKKKEVEMVTAKIENLKASTRRLDTEASSMEMQYSDIDKKFMTLLDQASFNQGIPELKTIADLP